jgi:tetratricopeptide (TPR) repeat protein
MKPPISSLALILALSFILSGATGWGASADELVKQGDVNDLKLNPSEALKFYLPAEKLEPRNSGILLRIARQYRHQMADASALNEKIRLSGLALGYAERAVVLAPKDSEAHLSIAICHAKSIELHGNREKMNALRQVKTSADQAIALDSDNDLAWYILGRWHQRVADMSGLKRKIAEMTYGDLPKATHDEAVKCFRKAIGLKSYRSVYYVDLGITYASMGNRVDAKKCIEKGLTLPNTGKDDPATKKRGEETLKTLN